jgi:hypothetical protein
MQGGVDVNIQRGVDVNIQGCVDINIQEGRFNMLGGVDVNIQGGVDVIGWNWQALKQTESWLAVAQSL